MASALTPPPAALLQIDRVTPAICTARCAPATALQCLFQSRPTLSAPFSGKASCAAGGMSVALEGKEAPSGFGKKVEDRLKKEGTEALEGALSWGTVCGGALCAVGH